MKREQSKPQARSSLGKWLTKISASPRPSVAQTAAEHPRCPGRLPRAGVSGLGGSGHRHDPVPTRRGAAGDAARGRRLRTTAGKAPRLWGSPRARRSLHPSCPAPRRARARVGSPREPLVSARPRQRERLAAMGPGGGRCAMADASFFPKKNPHIKKKKKRPQPSIFPGPIPCKSLLRGRGGHTKPLSTGRSAGGGRWAA